MSLRSVYERFLADPASAPLASDVSLIYITTTTTVNEAGAVLKHLSSQQRIVKKKAEKIIGVVEASDSLCLDVETTLEFVDGGGAYLPSLDDNFLVDHVATFPTVHIVRFNAQKEIQQIRLYWDQGSLLKQVEVIGARSRSWPIRDAKDQLRLITSATAGEPSGLVTPPNGSEKTAAPKEEQDRDTTISPSKKRIKDPYAAESLFELLSPGQDRVQPVVAPRAPATAKPPPRDYSELFVGEDDDAVPAHSSTNRPIAPKIGSSKHYKASPLFLEEEDQSVTQEEQKLTKPIAPKAGASKNFKPSRLFIDEEEEPVEDKQPAYKTHPKKFSHFELGDGDGEVEQQSKPIPSRPKSQHVAQWGFEDFVTPEKPKPKIRPSDTRHFAWSDDEAEDTPPARVHVAHPRRDAETHFKLQHDDSPDEEHVQPEKALGAHNKGMGLYENNLYDEEGSPTRHQLEQKAPLAIIPNGTHRKKDFDSHWSVTDANPAEDEPVGHENKKPISHDKLKHIKHMEASWAAYDVSPEQKAGAKPKRTSRNIAQPSWMLGDEDEGF
ncbi:hypothetical protein DTO212C5_2072 [Paecilomyces variotii]|nr:hypothetical protein DTO212C5_2072 [Paecilomyces variotii]